MDYLRNAVSYVWSSGANADDAKSDTEAKQQNESALIDGSVLVRGSGVLCQFEDGEFVEIQDKCEVLLVRESDFDTKFYVSDGGILCMPEIVSNAMQMTFEKEDHSIVWPIRIRGELSLMSFRFAKEEEERMFKMTFAVKAYEASTQQPFMASVKENDRGWVYDAHENSMDIDSEDDFEENDSLDFDAELELENLAERVDPNDSNRILNDSIVRDRAFVVRGARVGYFDTSDSGQLRYLGQIPELKTSCGELFKPSEAMLHQQDSRLMMLQPRQNDTVYDLDLETGKVVTEFKAAPDKSIVRLAPLNKYGQGTHESVVVGLNPGSVFQMDPRVGGASKEVVGFSYKKSPSFECVATSGSGQVAIGSKTGEIRMYTNVGKRAKTLLPGLGDPITYVDVTSDGSWILCTTDQYLLCIPTVMPDGSQKSGFNVRMGKQKPVPLKLQLSPRDILRYNIARVQFTPAKFNTGDNITEQWIVTSTGEHIITWNFRKVKQGRTNRYTIKRFGGRIVADQFRHNADDVVVTLADDVCLQKRSLRL
eukprot:237035_1